MQKENALYEAPTLKKIELYAQEDLLTEPSVSDTGFGWDDNGPVTPVGGDL